MPPKKTCRTQNAQNDSDDDNFVKILMVLQYHYVFIANDSEVQLQKFLQLGKKRY